MQIQLLNCTGRKTTLKCQYLVFISSCHNRHFMEHGIRSWWGHQMETFSALLAICAGNSPVPMNSPHKGQWRGVLMFSLICVWTNDWVNNREVGDVRRHRVHYDVIVMWEMLHANLGENSSFKSPVLLKILTKDSPHLTLNTMGPRQSGRHFADDIFRCIKISLKIVPKSLINNNPALV